MAKICFRFALPGGMLLQSETKIEPDLRLYNNKKENQPLVVYRPQLQQRGTGIFWKKKGGKILQSYYHMQLQMRKLNEKTLLNIGFGWPGKKRMGMDVSMNKSVLS